MPVAKNIQVDEFHRILHSPEYRANIEKGRQELESLTGKPAGEPATPQQPTSATPK